MLAIDFLELLGRVLVLLLLVQKIDALIVEAIGGLVGKRLILVAEHAAPRAATAA